MTKFISHLFALACILLTSFVSAPIASAQRFAKEAELLDPRNFSYSEAEFKSIAARIAHNSLSALGRADNMLNKIKYWVRNRGKTGAAAIAQDPELLLIQTGDIITELEIIIGLLPIEGDDSSRTAQQAKIKHLQGLMFEARDALYGAIDDIRRSK